MKDKFIFSKNFKEAADKLPDDLRLQFYDAMTDYVFNGIEPQGAVITALISAIKPTLDIEDRRGGAREGAGRKSKEIKNNQKNQNEFFEKIENQNNSNEIKVIQNENQKTKEKMPLNNPQKNKNKNIYSPSTSDDVVVPPLPENDDSGMLDIEELIAMTPPKPKEKKFTPPTVEDVAAYVADRKLVIDPKTFHDYFTAGKWKDSEGKPVKNWKQKALTWDSHERQRRTLAAARGLLPQKTAVASGSYDEGVPL